jgi:hypothetical protein
MLRHSLRLVLLAGLILSSAPFALAQGRGSYSGRSAYGQSLNGPAVSPYLYLLNGNSSNIGANYFTFTQPMQQQQQVNQQQYQQGAVTQQQLNALGKNAMQGNIPTLRATGNAASRMNYSHYYPGMSAAGNRGSSGNRGAPSGGGMGGGMGGMGMGGGF